MEKLLKPYDKEYMKMAMLKHEETFREQVYELHRLYQIQKMLMKDKSRRPNEQCQNRWNPNHINLDLERPAEEYNIIADLDGNGVVQIEDESEIELTLGPTSYNGRRKAAETPLNSDSGPRFSCNSSTGSSHMKRKIIPGSHQMMYTNQRFLNGGRNGSDDVEERMRQDRLKQSPWLCQVLSLNMT